MPYTSRIPAIAARLATELTPVVNKTGYMIEAEAKRRARVGVGYMRGQIRYHEMQVPVGFTEDPDNPVELEPAPPYTGTVVGGARYTIYNEYGTIYMAAQPMFGPASEAAQPFLISETIKAIRRAVL